MVKRRKTSRRNDESAPAATVIEPSIHPPRRRAAWIIGSVLLAAFLAAFFAWRSQNGSVPAPAPLATTTATPTVAEPRYVGGAECASCHASQSARWKGSHHDLAMKVADSQSVLGSFNNTKFTYAGVTSTFLRRDGKFFVNTDGPDGKLADFEIKYAFGVEPLQQYLIEFPAGRKQALSIAWDTRSKDKGGQRWFHLYPGQNIRAGDWLHWTAPGQNWNFTCAECHSTNLRKNYDVKSDTYNTTWSEINVSCEACHGPGSNHLSWARKTGDWQALAGTKGLAVALDERRNVTWLPDSSATAHRSVPRTSSRELDTCARCHGRSARISDDYMHGKPTLDTHRLTLLGAPMYWADGQMRDEVYNWGSFAQSKMHAQGVTCSDCHDAHSLKLKAAGNAVCAQCHQPKQFDTPQHTHHAAGTPAAQCTSCHMPTATYMIVDPRHDHSLRVPRPDRSVKLGTPNACNGCHTKKSAQWAADAIVRWDGKAPSGFQQFGEAFNAADHGTPAARDALVALIGDAAQPSVVRASALEHLQAVMTAAALPTVTRALEDADASVRLAAVEVIADTDQSTRELWLPRMLVDPVRMVRIEAASALAGPSEATLSPDARKRFESALGEYIAVQNYNSDRPEGRSLLGNLYAVRGDDQRAVAQYRAAITLDPTYVQAYANLADFYRSRGADDIAEATLKEGIARVPAAAPLHHALGLVHVRQKRADAIKELAEAARLDPANARFAYVYAIALDGAGRQQQALQVLAAAARRHPYDRSTLAALANYSARAGDMSSAQGYVKRLLEIDPQSPEYAQMSEQLDAAARR